MSSSSTVVPRWSRWTVTRVTNRLSTSSKRRLTTDFYKVVDLGGTGWVEVNVMSEGSGDGDFVNK